MNFESGKKYTIDHSACPNPGICLADPAGIIHDTAVITEIVEPTVVLKDPIFESPEENT